MWHSGRCSRASRSLCSAGASMACFWRRNTQRCTGSTHRYHHPGRCIVPLSAILSVSVSPSLSLCRSLRLCLSRSHCLSDSVLHMCSPEQLGWQEQVGPDGTPIGWQPVVQRLGKNSVSVPFRSTPISLVKVAKLSHFQSLK